jgi:uncharacterized protein (TIGR00369 family)
MGDRGSSVIFDEPIRGSVPPPWFTALPGIERIRAFNNGQLPLPPMCRLFGIRPAHVGPGSGTWTMPASGSLVSEAGTLEISTLIESALTGTSITTLPPGTDIEPVSLAIDYFRPTRPESGSLLARARVVNASRLYSFSEVEIEDPAGRQIAHATSHAAVRRVQPPPPAPPVELRPVEEPIYGNRDPYLRSVSSLMSPIEAAQENGGLALLRRIADGSFVVPYQALLPVDFVEIEEGRVVLAVPASEWLSRFSRSVAPGCIKALAVRTVACALLTLSRRDHSIVGLEHNARFYTPVSADGRPLRAEALITRHGADLVTSDVHVFDADRKLVASGYGMGSILEISKRHKRPTPEVKRIVATLLFVDIVGSTAHADRLGDARWRILLEEYRTLSRAEIARYDGIEVETIGDGVFIRFDSTARALECAKALRLGVRRLGIGIRAGVHTGECELQSGKLAGMAVHIAARVQAIANGDEIVVSRTVKDLAVGSGMHFEDRGEHTLKGVPGDWRLYTLVG